jgi:hypothetical protein
MVFRSGASGNDFNAASEEAKVHLPAYYPLALQIELPMQQGGTNEKLFVVDDY